MFRALTCPSSGGTTVQTQHVTYMFILKCALKLVLKNILYLYCLFYMPHKPAPMPKQPPLQWVPVHSRGLKWPESVSNYSPPSIAGLRMVSAILPPRLCACMGMSCEYRCLLFPLFRRVSHVSSISSVLIYVHTNHKK